MQISPGLYFTSNVHFRGLDPPPRPPPLIPMEKYVHKNGTQKAEGSGGKRGKEEATRG